jgi:hypothetical protein
LQPWVLCELPTRQASVFQVRHPKFYQIPQGIWLSIDYTGPHRCQSHLHSPASASLGLRRVLPPPPLAAWSMFFGRLNGGSESRTHMVPGQICDSSYISKIITNIIEHGLKVLINRGIHQLEKITALSPKNNDIDMHTLYFSPASE